MSSARRRALTVTADGANNQTVWNSLKKGGMALLSGTFVGTVTLQRRDTAGNIQDATTAAGAVITFSAPGTYPIAPTETQAEYRLNCKSGAFTSGTILMAVEGR